MFSNLNFPETLKAGLFFPLTQREGSFVLLHAPPPSLFWLSLPLSLSPALTLAQLLFLFVIGRVEMGVVRKIRMFLEKIFEGPHQKKRLTPKKRLTEKTGTKGSSWILGLFLFCVCEWVYMCLLMNTPVETRGWHCATLFLARPAGQGATCLCLPSSVITAVCQHTWCYVEAGDQNSGSHVTHWNSYSHRFKNVLNSGRRS